MKRVYLCTTCSSKKPQKEVPSVPGAHGVEVLHVVPGSDAQTKFIK